MTKRTTDLKIEDVSTSAVKPVPYNVRRLTAKETAKVVRIMAECRWADPNVAHEIGVTSVLLAWCAKVIGAQSGR